MIIPRRPVAALTAAALIALPTATRAEPHYERQRYFPRRTFDLIAHVGAAIPQADGYNPAALAFSGAAFWRLSSTWGGPSLAVDVVQRARNAGSTKPEFLLYLGHRIAFTKLPRVEPWIEPIGLGLGFYRPALGVDIFVVPDVRLGCAAKLPVFFMPNREIFQVGVELTAGLTLQLGTTTGLSRDTSRGF